MLEFKQDNDLRDPIFKGCTRPAMLFGVPLIPLLIISMTIIFLSVCTKVLFSLILIPIIIGMRQVASYDDQQFRLLGLKILFRIINYNHNRAFWKASTYSPFTFRKRKSKS